MTVETTTNKKSFTADGVTDEFDYDFLVLDEGHMVVYLDDDQYTGGITITGIGDADGGTVTLSDMPDSGVIVTLLRSVPLTQIMSYPTLSAFPSKSHESALDKLTMVSQQLQEQMDRALKQGLVSDDTMDWTMPAYDAGAAILFDSTEKKLTSGGFDLASMETMVNTATAAASTASSAASTASSASASAVAARDTILAMDVRQNLLASTTYTVGSTGDFATLNAAIAELSHYAPVYTAAGIAVTLQLQSGFVMREQVLVTGLDLSWINITSVDATVAVGAGYITTSFNGYVGLFCGYGAKIPQISVQFNMTGVGGGANGIVLLNGSRGVFYNGGISHAPVNACVVVDSTLIGSDTLNFSYAGDRAVNAINACVKLPNAALYRAGGPGVVASHSVVDISGAGLGYAGSHGLSAYYASRIYAGGAVTSSAGGYGFYIASGSIADLGGAICSSPGGHCCYAVANAIVNARAANFNSSSYYEYAVGYGAWIGATSPAGGSDCNIATNTLTANGIISM